MNPRSEAFLRRHARLVGGTAGAGSVLPMALFLIAVTTLQFRWWRAPWPETTNQSVLAVTAGLASCYTLLFLAASVFRFRRARSVADEIRESRKGRVNAIETLVYAIIVAWSLTALSGHVSHLLFWLFLLAWLILQVAVFLAAYRGGRA
jgi:hypothetical protein